MQMRRVLEVWRRYFKVPVIEIAFPRQFYTPKGKEYFAHSLEVLAEELTGVSGQSFSCERLLAAVRLFNRIREGQRRLYGLLKLDAPPITWRQVAEVMQAGLVLDREEYAQLLDRLWESLKTREASSGRPQRVRLLLVGGMLAPGDNGVLDVLADLGVDLVMDELCTGSRGIFGDVAAADFASLARRYLDNVPCGSLPYPRLEDDPRHRHILRLLDEYRINGVIYYTLRFCDAYSFKAGHLRQLLQERGIPWLHIKSDYSSAHSGQIRTRIEALIESIYEQLR